MIKVLANNKVQLCCNGQNCPIVTDLGDGNVEILDDYGNKIVMKKEQAALLSDGVKVLDDKALLLG